MTDSKKTKITAILSFDIDKKEEGTLRLWGVDFAVKDGKATASLPAAEAKAMIAAKRAK